jgi:hypothetical protein
MAIINKVTTLAPINGVPLTDAIIQSHFDEQNADGYFLVGIDNLVGWYRFFWAKEIE